MQREMPMLGDVKRMQMVPMEIIEKCRTPRQALALTVQWSGHKHAYIAESIGMKSAQFSKILTGIAHLDEDKRDALMDVCGNEAMLQHQAWRRGYKLVRDDAAERIQRLEAELAEARGDKGIAA